MTDWVKSTKPRLKRKGSTVVANRGVPVASSRARAAKRALPDWAPRRRIWPALRVMR
jgi:hypothetical protein